MALSCTNSRGGGTQVFSHTLRHLTFADKHICTDRECSLLTSFQAAEEEDNDQHFRAGPSQFIQCRAGRTGEQFPIRHQHIRATYWRLG